MKKFLTYIIIGMLAAGLMPSQLLAATVRAKDGTVIMTARSPEQVPRISKVASDLSSELTIDSSDGSLQEKDGSMEDVIPMTRDRRKKLTGGSRKANRKAIKKYLKEKGLYSVREENGNLKVAFPYSSQRIMVDSASLTETHQAETAVYYAPRDEYILSYESQEATRDAYETYLKEYGPDHVFLDLPVKADSKSWGVEAMELDQLADQANQSSVRNKTLVAIIDSGVNSSHAMFSGRTFSSASKSFISSSWKDDCGHGSHVAGILAEGTSKDVEFLALKILNYNGEGSLCDMLLALEYSVAQGADVVNFSVGVNLKDCIGEMDNELGMKITTGDYYNYINSFLAYARQSGVTICAASGNEGKDMGKVYTVPAISEHVISVGSVSRSAVSEQAEGKMLTRTSYSNYGAALDFVAPGDGISSASYLSNSSYRLMSGTSMATPHIAAVAAMIKVYHPSYSFGQVYNALAQATGAKSKINADIGYGMPVFSASQEGSSLFLSFTEADKETVSRPTAPGRVSGLKAASAAYNKIKVSWSGVSGASGYVLYMKKGQIYRPLVTTSGNSAVINGLTCGNYYYFKVAAYKVSANKRIYGKESAVAKGRPLPGKTTKILTRKGKKKIKIKWKKVAGASGYQISRATKAKGRYKSIKRTKARSYTDKVKRKKKYYYRIRAYRLVNGVRIYGAYVYFKAKSR